MFYNCGLPEADLSWMDFSNISTSSIRSILTNSYVEKFNFGQNFFKIDASKRKDTFYAMFNNCQGLKEIDLSLFKDWDSNVSFSRAFYRATNLSDLNFASWGHYQPTSIYEFCQWGTNLYSVDLGDCDCSLLKSANNTFDHCPNLTILKNSFYNYGKANNGIVLPVYLRHCANLTEASVMNMIDGLYDIKDAYNRTVSIYVHADVKNSISESNIAYAQEKGWYIS